ncbi:MAG: PSD1 and planctomycete cytochrome C domain-containing protein [Planctomycetota bacterium]|nr:PSD1 and planctomycete cytochrome C domain-containing protein [Planctomycetota bacterium]
MSHQRLTLTQFVTLAMFLASASWLSSDVAADARAIDFARDIRPLLSNACFKCHGPDEEEREGDLRLDTPEGAYADLGGYQAVKPNEPEASTLIARITTSDPDERMPPPDSGLELSAADVALLTAWITQGGKYDQHWSFRPVNRSPVPDDDPAVTQNPIDAFVTKRLEHAGLRPANEADRPTLVRRVSLDLLGLPPSRDDVSQFINDQRPGAYDRMVDRVLANPHYGERWGRHWLDQARYADTHGYTVDSERTMWPYRDWVIQAINADLPFDRFTIEQLAGDLLPTPTQDQLIATGFHRNTLVNQEGGTDAEQFRNEAVVDRVNTTGAVWMGLTVGCAQCHTHKFDPLTQHEYYRLFAFFNSSQDVNSVNPTLTVATEAEQARIDELDRQIAEAKEAVAQSDQQRLEQNEATLKQLQERIKLAKNLPATMIMRELDKPRETNVLIRGDFLRKGDVVEADAPTFLPGMDGEASHSRLDLATWLVSGEHPLTARVTVNRVWGRLFGQALVETENDFGLQGTPPTHPDLLDWLASELMESGWSMKQLHRVIVTSAAYRQSSHQREDAERLDPSNKLISRQTRLRVDAEIVRDLALAASGLLDGHVGGPSVYPPQPSGVYAFTQRNAAWPTSKGADRYRRGLYTFFMRSAPYPMLTTFDTPRFNTTCTRRVRSNTPLQSLTLANDETMLEAARALGRRLIHEASADGDRIGLAYQLCFARDPSQQEADRLLAFVGSQRTDFLASPTDAKAISEAAEGSDEQLAELAAWTIAARVLLNLDEFITRE